MTMTIFPLQGLGRPQDIQINQHLNSKWATKKKLLLSIILVFS